MEIIDDINLRRLITHDELLEKLCAEVSDDTAGVILELARSITSSPLGSGDGYVAKAQALLEKREANKIVVIEGCPEFQKLIAGVSR